MTPGVLLLVVVLLWLIAPLLVLVDARDTVRPFWSGLVGAGSVALLALGISGLQQSSSFTLPAPFYLAVVSVDFRLDALAAWFLILIAGVTLPLTLYLPGYVAHLRKEADMRLFWGALLVLLASMVLVTLAANALTFLVAWELMSLSSFMLVATTHHLASTRTAALIYLGATRVATAFLAGGFLWAHHETHSWSFDHWHLNGPAALGPGVLVLIALGVKAGMWPFHLWLPVAHPAAPSPVSALMSAVMVKIAVYMIIRLFVFGPAFHHPSFGFVILALGSISAFWGVAFALQQHDLKRLLAYSTVENVGLILMGVGVCLVAARYNLPGVARLALAAALFHTVNHAVFKSLLFLSAGAIDMQAHSRDLDFLGGLAARMRWTSACFILGSATICALPPLSGFASEWVLYQSVLGLACGSATPVVRFVSCLIIGWIALVGALALACFVRACGVALLGRPRADETEHATEVPMGMVTAQVLLALACIALGLFAPMVLSALDPMLAFLDPSGAPLASTWTLPTSSLVLVLMVTIGVGAAWLSQASRCRPIRSCTTWACGFGVLSPRMQVTATSFAQPIARMFGALFRYAVHLRIEGSLRTLFPDKIIVEPHLEAVLESRVYTPLVRAVARLGGVMLKLQTGSIHLYLFTMFVTLLLLMYIGGRGL